MNQNAENEVFHAQNSPVEDQRPPTQCVHTRVQTKRTCLILSATLTTCLETSVGQASWLAQIFMVDRSKKHQGRPFNQAHQLTCKQNFSVLACVLQKHMEQLMPFGGCL